MPSPPTQMFKLDHAQHRKSLKCESISRHCGKRVDKPPRKACGRARCQEARCSAQLAPNINSLQALGNSCFHKHKYWVISRFGVIQMQSGGGHQQKTSERKINKLLFSFYFPHGRNIFKSPVSSWEIILAVIILKQHSPLVFFSRLKGVQIVPESFMHGSSGFMNKDVHRGISLRQPKWSFAHAHSPSWGSSFFETNSCDPAATPNVFFSLRHCCFIFFFLHSPLPAPAFF